jgi:hypothetical protein
MGAVEQRGLTTSKDRLGVTTVSKQWVVDTLEEVETVGDATVLGLPEEDRSSAKRDDMRHLVTINYRGVKEDTKPEKEKWGGKLMFREDPIQSHPNWPTLRDTYGWVDEGSGKGHFPEEMPTDNAGARVGKGVAVRGGRNPMFGAKTFPVIVGEITHSYLRTTWPSDVLDNIGRVLEDLPGNSGIRTPEGYAWLVVCPDFDQEGEAGWRFVDHYKLIPKDGYLYAAYMVLRSGR